MLLERDLEGTDAGVPGTRAASKTTSGRIWFRICVSIVALHLVATAVISELGGFGVAVAVCTVVAAAFAVCWLEIAGGRALGVALCAATATIGIAVGVGITVNRITRTGFEAGDVPVVPALVAAVCLIVLGASRAVSGRSGWVKGAAIPAIIAFVYYGAAPVTLGVWATNRPADAGSGRMPTDIGIEFEDVVLHADDGSSLAAWYVPSLNGAAVIVRHGASSSKEAVLDQLGVLAHAGYGVLAMDARGHGDSEGEANAFGWYAEDVSIGTDYVLDRPEIKRGIGVLGLSMGGEEAITAAADDERISAVVAEGVTIRSTADFLTIDKGIAMWLSAPHYWLMYTTADLISDTSPPRPLVEAVAAVAPRPLLLIAAGESADEQRFGEHFVAKAPDSTSLWIVPGSTHTHGLATAPNEWAQRVLAVFDAALAPS